MSRGATKRDLADQLRWFIRQTGETFEAEYRFHPTRRWRFDLAWPEEKVAVEVNGGEWMGRGRHGYGTGAIRDAEKLRAAVEFGWSVLVYTGSDIKQNVSGAWAQIQRVLEERRSDG